MKTHVQRWGNSLGIRIPRILAQQLGLTDGVVVDMDTHDDALVIRRDNATLEELLANVHPDQLHEEISFGEQAGQEEW